MKQKEKITVIYEVKMMNELKPCPFCGCKLEKQEYIPLCYRYKHQENGCLLERMCIYSKNEIKAWNRRVDDESKHK